MVSLTSADRYVSATSAKCLRLIAGAERQKGGAPPHLISEEEKAKRYPVYEQLGHAKSMILGIHVCPRPSVQCNSSLCFALSGRVADQKRIRKYMRLIAIPSPTHVAVWEECYWRWCSLSELATRMSLDPSEEGPLPNGDKSLTTEVIILGYSVINLLTMFQRSVKRSGTTSLSSWPVLVRSA